MSGTTAYSLPQTAVARLDAMVDRIVANPGVLVDTNALKEAAAQLDVRNVIATLPEEITLEDFVGILKLAMLTECATDSYAAVFQEGAATYDAPWLARFNEVVWVPDEYTHYTPYKYMLQSLGYSEEELNREMAETQQKTYEHCCGKSPVELTTYGTVQEFLTDHWHGLIARLLREAAPYAAQAATMVKRRETLHTVWYRDMTTVQIEGNGDLISMVAGTLTKFQMPGTSLVPEHGQKALQWMQATQVDFHQIARDLVRNFSETAGSLKRSGMLLIEMAVHRNYPIGPLPAKMVRTMMNRFGGFGYGILGEAALQKVGLPVPAEWSVDGNRITDRLRSTLLDFITSRVDVRSITGETGSASA